MRRGSGSGRFSLRRRKVAPLDLLLLCAELEYAVLHVNLFLSVEEEFAEVAVAECPLRGIQCIAIESEGPVTFDPGAAGQANRRDVTGTVRSACDVSADLPDVASGLP